MVIRNVQEKDFNQCLELLKEEELKDANGDYFKKEWLYDYLSDGLFLVAETENDIVGLIFGETLKPDGVMLWMFAVDKNFRRLGIGKKLLAEFENKCRKMNKNWIILYSTTTESTLTFYKRNSYNEGKKCIEFKKDL